MANTVSDFIVERLHAWGVRRIFGYPGDGINGMIGALARATDKIHYVQTRHEELAAFMASAHAKFSGELGVCLATSGPGAIHLLNGLYDAKADHQPVLAIVGQQARTAIGSNYQQEVNLEALFGDVAHEYVYTAMVPAQVRHLVDRAIRIALDQRTVTCLILPNDLQELDAIPVPPRAHGTVHSGIGINVKRLIPDVEEVKRAAEIINSGKKFAILAGAGALHATDELIEIAHITGAGIAKALLGKAAVPDDLPFVTGAIGLLGTKPSWDMMNECDTLLIVGSAFPYAEFLPAEGQARGVQIDIDARMLGLRYPTELNIVGDSQLTLRAMIPYLTHKSDRSWIEHIEHNVRRWWKALEQRAMNVAQPINPQRVFWEISPCLPDNCIVAGDSGSSTNWYARDIKLRRGMMASLSGGLASMGSGVPYAVAAKFAHPDRPVLAICGDGAMLMNGINCLITVAEAWRSEQWSNSCFVVLVLNNGDLNQVSWEQRIIEGDPKFSASQDVPNFPYAEYANLIGLIGIKVDDPENLTHACNTAFAADKPVVLEVMTDPNVPPLPPHITAKQVKAYLSALLHGDPDGLAIVKATAKEWWASLP